MNKCKDISRRKDNGYINPYRKFFNAYIPNWLLRRPISEVSHGAKIVYGRLCQHAGKNGDCFPKQKTLAKECGMSARTAQKYIKELKDLELIEIWRYGKKRANRYKFLKHKWMKFDNLQTTKVGKILPHDEYLEHLRNGTLEDIKAKRSSVTQDVAEEDMSIIASKR
ncbi:MAG: helix-turn-helix domain-containing protein [bacterium]